MSARLDRIKFNQSLGLPSDFFEAMTDEEYDLWEIREEEKELRRKSLVRKPFDYSTQRTKRPD